MKILSKYIRSTRNDSSLKPLSAFVLAVFGLLCGLSPASATPLRGLALANFVVAGKAGITNISKNKISGNLRPASNTSTDGGYYFATGSLQTNTPIAQQDQLDLEIAIKDLKLSDPITIIDPVFTAPILPVIESESGGFGQVAYTQSAATAVPEPATLALLGLGLAGLGFARRRHG